MTDLVPPVPPLGLIEGYFGTPWRFTDRDAVVAALATAGFGFYHYAPKADPFLRRRWQEPHPPATIAALAAFADHCRRLGLRFGVGLSPYQAFDSWGDGTRAALVAKVRALDAIGLDDLAILFDDMRGDRPDLAARQAEIVHAAAAATRATRIVTCPSYYCDDTVLDRVFGQRPEAYLETLGRLLDPAIGVYWTGEEVCSRSVSPGHLARIADALGRKPWLWDNWPVNDGPVMSRHLHLRGFTGRMAGSARHLAAHAVNPALQPMLSCIPALTLPRVYAEGEAYDYRRAWLAAAGQIGGPAVAAMLARDVLALEDAGLDRITERIPAMRARWEGLLADPKGAAIAAEVIAFLDGTYATTADEVQTQ